MNFNGSTNFSFGWIFHNLFKHSVIFGNSGCFLFVANISNVALRFLRRVILYIFVCFLRSSQKVYNNSFSKLPYMGLSISHVYTDIRDYYFLNYKRFLLITDFNKSSVLGILTWWHNESYTGWQ